MIRRIKPDEARLGMFIRGFGGSFFHHPFWRTKFKIASQPDLDAIRSCGLPYVVIDDELGVGPLAPDGDDTCEQLAGPKQPASVVERIGENRLRRAPAPTAPAQPTPVAAAHTRAVQTVAQARVVVDAVFDAARLGTAVPVHEALTLVGEIDAMFANGEHMLLDVVRMKTADEYTYLHSVAVCALMLKLARHLGMPPDAARECGLAGLLHDVGKMKIAPEVLHKRGRLDDSEFALVKSHAEEGYAILRNVPELPAAALDVARLHHEKMDGSGYPLGLAGEAIPLVARMGAICDVYDALTSNRSYKTASAPAEALAMMMGSPGHFDPDLLAAFAASLDAASASPAEAATSA